MCLERPCLLQRRPQFSCAPVVRTRSQVLVEVLDRHFRNVCELDLIFNSDQVHWVVDEMIVGGLVVET